MSKQIQLSCLPSEILSNVFEHVQDTSDWRIARNTFYECLFVCKKLKKLAETHLYKNVCLQKNDIEPFAWRLFFTSHSNKLGDLVKSVNFYPDNCGEIVSVPEEVNLYLNMILKYTPNIEKFVSASTEFETFFTWQRLLLAPDNQNKYLKQFSLKESWSTADKRMYTLLSLKYKQTLTNVRLYPVVKQDDSIINDGDFHEVKNHLSEFKSLEKVQLSGIFVKDKPIITELDGTINNFNCKVRSLHLEDCKFLENHDYPTNLKPNNSVTTLDLGNPKLCAQSIQYFATKLKGLKKLTVITGINNIAQLETKEEYAEWWNRLNNLCKQVQQYKIDLKDFKASGYLEQIKGSAKLLQDTKQQEANDTTEFIMRIGKQDPSLERYMIEMRRNNSMVRLFESKISHNQFMHNTDFSEIFSSIQQFTPKTITILNVEHLLNYEETLEYHEVFSCNGTLEEYFTKLCSKKTWNIFHGVASLIKDRSGSVIHLEKMVFPNSVQGFDQVGQKPVSENTNVSEMKLTNSLIYPNVLSKFCLKMPKIERLVFDGCIFMTNSLYQLEIDLGDMELGRLELDLSRVFHSQTLISPGGGHTITVSTRSATTTAHTFIKDENHKTYQAPSSTLGSPDNFLVSVKCKELESLAICGKEVPKISH
ncbi:hypothetical protein [Parasitella parasitica]|uniref:F-box domain-containing protein n=1 Tax=Parasitella parasitica TaxID=35722 RepID=A0A0B7MQV5_9FUNG|nr:hypothetical protein [Parasitella parasitica]